jgi:N utilization substance protein B
MAPELQRRRARELALKAVYALAISEGEPQDIRDSLIRDDTLAPRHIQYAKVLFSRVQEETDWAESVIQKLAENWALQRIARIDRCILQLALVELKTVPDVPEKVVINEAIELAKKYSTAESAAFVNGILDRFVKTMLERPIK